MAEVNNCIMRHRDKSRYCDHSIAKFGLMFKSLFDSPGKRSAVFFSRERDFNYAWAEYTFKRYYAWADHFLKTVFFSRSRGGLTDKNWKGRKKMHLIMIKIAFAPPIVFAKCSLKLAPIKLNARKWESGSLRYLRKIQICWLGSILASQCSHLTINWI